MSKVTLLSQTPIRNVNYAATVVSIKSIIQLEGCDNIVATPLLGYQAIVGISTAVGDLGVVFTAETQLSDEMASFNNLYRHSERNQDKDSKGYLEDSARIKAVKLRGHRSDALFLSLDSLAWTGADLSQLKVGDTFDYLNGNEICRKYEVKTKNPTGTKTQQSKSRVEEKFFPKHFDTENYFRNSTAIPAAARISITQKLHGTSLRVANIPVDRKLSWLERLAKRFGVRVTETEYSMVYGSRNQTKDANDPENRHFYETDIWTLAGREFDGIPQDYLVFAEIIGWTPGGAPIQTGYTYALERGTFATYVYRVATINSQGRTVDLSWEQVETFCEAHGLKVVPTLYRGLMASYDPEEIAADFLDKKFHLDYPQAVPLSKDSKCDEGVCIRAEGLTPKVFKAKSPMFLQHETKMLDKEVDDIEVDA